MKPQKKDCGILAPQHVLLVAKADELERLALDADAMGHKAVATRRRRRAKFIREKAATSASVSFEDLANRANAADAAAQRAERSGDHQHSAQLRQRAFNAREEACGFDFRAASKEFVRPRGRASIGMNQDALDAVVAMCPDKKSRPFLLRRLLEEAIFAARAWGCSVAPSGGAISFPRLNAVSGDSRWCEHYQIHQGASLAAEFVLAQSAQADPPAA